MKASTFLGAVMVSSLAGAGLGAVLSSPCTPSSQPPCGRGFGAGVGAVAGLFIGTVAAAVIDTTQRVAQRLE